MWRVGPDYIISSPWPEIPVLTLPFKQEPLSPNINNGDYPAN